MLDLGWEECRHGLVGSREQRALAPQEPQGPVTRIARRLETPSVRYQERYLLAAIDMLLCREPPHSWVNLDRPSRERFAEWESLLESQDLLSPTVFCSVSLQGLFQSHLGLHPALSSRMRASQGPPRSGADRRPFPRESGEQGTLSGNGSPDGPHWRRKNAHPHFLKVQNGELDGRLQMLVMAGIASYQTRRRGPPARPPSGEAPDGCWKDGRAGPTLRWQWPYPFNMYIVDGAKVNYQYRW